MRGENTMTPVFELKNVNYYYDHKKSVRKYKH
ncbi:ABC transporter ATP-binding protein [Staphylococcus aureus]|nr:ABC transporter ATP-binding protein [Staphylococcus aureus]